MGAPQCLGALAHWQAKEAPRIHRYWGTWGLCSWGLPSRTRPVFQASTTTWRPSGLRKAATDCIPKSALTRCSTSSLGSSPPISSSHPGKSQAGDHSACSFSSQRLGRYWADTPRYWSLASCQRKKLEAPGSTGPPSYCQAGRVGKRQGRSWQHSGSPAAVPSLSESGFARLEKHEEPASKTVRLHEAPSWPAPWAETALPHKGQRGTVVSSRVDSLGPGSPGPGPAPCAHPAGSG